MNLFIITDDVREHFHEPSCSKIGTRMIVAEAREPDARDRHPPDRLAIVGEQGAIDGTIDDPATLLERPDWSGATEIEPETVVPREIVGGPRCPVAFQISRGCYDLSTRGTDSAGHQAGVGKPSNAKRDVGAIEIEIDDLVGEREVDDDVGIGLRCAGRWRKQPDQPPQARPPNAAPETTIPAGVLLCMGLFSIFELGRGRRSKASGCIGPTLQVSS